MVQNRNALKQSKLVIGISFDLISCDNYDRFPNHTISKHHFATAIKKGPQINPKNDDRQRHKNVDKAKRLMVNFVTKGKSAAATVA